MPSAATHFSNLVVSVSLLQHLQRAFPSLKDRRIERLLVDGKHSKQRGARIGCDDQSHRDLTTIEHSHFLIDKDSSIWNFLVELWASNFSNNSIGT